MVMKFISNVAFYAFNIREIIEPDLASEINQLVQLLGQ